MILKKKKDILVGLDVGTTKICTVVAERDGDDTIRVIGIGQAPSQGLRKGVVINVEKTVEAIEKSIIMAEESAGVEINSVFVGIAGGHIQSIKSRGVVPVSGDNGEITDEDVRKVIAAAKAISLPMEREIIHAIPQEFIVDGQDGILDPIGMTGVRLEAEVNIVTAAVSSAQNIVKSINKANVDVVGIILQPIASSIATLTQEEKESGVVLIDIGGGTTDYAFFVDGSLRHTGVLAIGGDHLTNDVKIRFNIPTMRAEEAKIKFGYAMSSRVPENEEFVMPGTFGYPARSMLRRDLSDVIESRLTEMLDIVKTEMDKTDCRSNIGSGIVMTGGASLVPGTIDLASSLFHVPVRLGIPRDIPGLKEMFQTPVYSTGVGLVLYAMNSVDDHMYANVDTKEDHLFRKLTQEMHKMIKKYF
ncbi:MAG: cell division protein FtsA [Candidatus Auribacterota bacterium]|jgi:cell division protein FtsA|uniref:Cell division protein FtsA n=1 Tax=Candidatus Auribacter fodinae TaxID=2093366 RepID=A0A3A4R8U0_9BACT|nr:MAG: cell division protein FtsA [Candidatus Auribacter fodinae]